LLNALELKIIKIGQTRVDWVVPTLQETKEAYLRLSFKYHPDKPGGD